LKIIKLDRRFIVHKKFGLTVALKFDSYSGPGHYLDVLSRTKLERNWADRNSWPCMDWFGRTRYTKLQKYRPFYIGFRDPETLTMLMLMADPKELST